MNKTMSSFMRFLVLTMIQVFGGDCAILAGVSDDMEYVDGKATGKRLGTKYTVVCPKHQYMTVVVKVPDGTPAITQDALDATDVPVWVTFEGFAGRIYTIRDEVGLTCKAEKIVVLPKGKDRGAGV